MQLYKSHGAKLTAVVALIGLSCWRVWGQVQSKALDPEALRRLLAVGGNPTERRKFALNASQVLAADAVMAHSGSLDGRGRSLPASAGGEGEGALAQALRQPPAHPHRCFLR